MIGDRDIVREGLTGREVTQVGFSGKSSAGSEGTPAGGSWGELPAVRTKVLR